MALPHLASRTGQRWLRLGLGALTLVALTGCAGTPDFAELEAQVEPPGTLTLAPDAELRVWIGDAGGTLAETRATPSGPGPWPVTLRFDRRTLDAARSPQLSAELRQQGSLTHTTSEPAGMPTNERGPVNLRLEPRP
ncbi:MAG: YbaY family lipoprotein [Halomonas sp.]|nr:YbaY family lipoprotein [Halomonas sp.]MCC5882284.1 YbaY family lipoprotein [Halomonas sp.]